MALWLNFFIRVNSWLRLKFMMETKATLRYGRIGPQKVRDIGVLILGKEAKIALGLLANLQRRGAFILAKLIKSALSNAKSKNPKTTPEDFYLKTVVVDGGPVAKRSRAAAMGRSTSIKKRTSHITVVLANKKNGSKS